MKLSGKKGVQHIVMALAQLGLREVIICPGSRNAPFTISFSRHPAFSCTSIRDERSAAFFALGKAVELQEPVVVVCTSGSAALNFSPAISEAYYQRIPLIVLTADRPQEWIDQGDGQTINQTALYRNFIRKSYSLRGEVVTQADYWYNERCLSEGFNTAAYSDRGPVHFNIPLDEPLYDIGEATGDVPKIFKEIKTNKTLAAESLSILAEEFFSCRKVMILAGQFIKNPDYQEVLSKMAAFENVVILTESLANVHHPRFIENIDRCITNLDEGEAKDWMPELLITTGGAIVSKRIKSLLRNHGVRHHWNVDLYDATRDTYQALTRAISQSPVDFFRQLHPVLSKVSSDYQERWVQRRDRLAELHEDFFNQCAHSDLLVFYKLFQKIPSGLFVHISNSSAIRYAQLFDNQKIAGSFCNRGTSGIDGCTSTVMGAAVASPQKNFLLITGDVAFHYDINGLWNENRVDNLKIIVINNGGGGIFRIISAPHQLNEMEDFFETSMTSNTKRLAEHFDWEYLSADNGISLEEALHLFFDTNTKRTILEVFTNPGQNPIVLEQYWKFFSEKNKAHE